MPFFVFSIWHFAGVALGLAGLACLVLAMRATWRFRECSVFGAEPRQGVSVLKPVYGTNPTFTKVCALSACRIYPKYEVIFGAPTHWTIRPSRS